MAIYGIALRKRKLNTIASLIDTAEISSEEDRAELLNISAGMCRQLADDLDETVAGLRAR